MSLFFYGAVELKNDSLKTASNLRNLGNDLNWKLRFNLLQQEYPINELFGLPRDIKKDFFVFELESSEKKDVYAELYDDYGGQLMVQHYRAVARDIGTSGHEELGFASLESVNEYYKQRPYELSVIVFIRNLTNMFSDRDVVFCLDEGFENRFTCTETTKDKEGLLQEVWLTIAFGYTWPNLRLWFKPSISAPRSEISQYTSIITTVELRSEFSERTIPKGTIGTVVECYNDPEGYCVDLSIPSPDLVGGFTTENMILTRDQFDIRNE